MKLKYRVVLVALVAGASIGVVAPSAVHATAGGPMTAHVMNGNASFTGTSGDDLLVIGVNGNLLTNNRFAAGDPGFASATDFDSSVSGVQSLADDGAHVSFSLGDGDDTVRIVGAMPYPLLTSDFGSGSRDTIDLTNYSSSANHGADFAADLDPTITDVEQVSLGPAQDTFDASALNAPNGLQIVNISGDDDITGSPGNDTIDEATGHGALHGGDGDDHFVVQSPLPSSPETVDGGPGVDTLTLDGTNGGVTDEVVADAAIFDPAHPDGGIDLPNMEHVAPLFSSGDPGNVVTVEPQPTLSVTATGDAYSSELDVDAYERSAAVTLGVPNGPRSGSIAVPGYAPIVVNGYGGHIHVVNEGLLVTAAGAGGGPHVRAFRSDLTPVASFFAYDGTFTGGVNVAVGDLAGDGAGEIVTAPGAGGGPHVRVFFADGTDTEVGFMAYDPAFSGGVRVATADVDADGVDEIVTVPAQGGGPHVRIWSGDGQLLHEWMAPGFGNTGLYVSRGPSLGPGGADLIIVSAASGPSLTRVFNADGTPAAGFGDLSPYGAFGGGAAVARGEFDGVARAPGSQDDEIVTAAGPGGGPHVRVVTRSGSSYADVGSFYAYDPNFHGGVSVTTCNFDGGDDEVVTGAGPGGGPHVRMFAKDGSPLSLSFMAYDPQFAGGVRVACGGAESKQY